MKNVLVIGVGGLGSEVAKIYHNEGSVVYGTYRNDVPHIEGITLLECDVTNEASITSCVSELRGSVDQIDVVVDTVSAELTLEPIESFDKAVLNKELDVAAVGSARVLQGLLPLLKKSDAATVIYVLSNAIETLPSRMFTYTVSKYARLGLMKAAGAELQRYGIRTLGVSPGYIETEMLGAFPEKLLEIAKSEVGGSFIQPTELAKAIYKMTSSDIETGTNLSFSNAKAVGDYLST